jgi:hypothetical protein
MIDEQRYRALIQQLATGGITGNKTYHQYHDQFVPVDSEGAGYANGGGVGSMMKAKRGLVNEPGGYAGYYAGGGADYIGLNPKNAPIRVEDLTVEDNDGNFLISAADALENQDGIIGATTNIMEPGVQTIEGALINDDYPNDKIRSMVTTPNRFSNTVAPAPSTPEIYQDLIMNPEYMPNRLQNIERNVAIDNMDFEEIPGFNFKDAPTSLKSRLNNLEYINNPNVGIIDNKILSRGNPEKSLVNRTKNMFSNVKDGITSVGQRFKEGANMVFSPFSLFANLTNPLNPKSSNYNPNLVGQLNALDQMGNMLYNDPNSGLLKYGSGSVLAGQNAISGFGTNDYLKQLEKKQTYFEKRIAANKKYNKDTYAATLAEIEKEKARQAAITEAANAAASNNNQGGGDGRYGRGSDGQQSYDFGQGFGIGATTGGPVSNRTGRGRTGYADGGIVSLKI